MALLTSGVDQHYVTGLLSGTGKSSQHEPIIPTYRNPYHDSADVQNVRCYAGYLAFIQLEEGRLEAIL